MTVNYTFASLLDKMQNSDRDIRFMATTDLLLELQKDSFKLDDDNERTLVHAILKVLRDTSGEVQNLGVKCINRAVERCKEQSTELIIMELTSQLISENGDERLRDISSLGLKSACQSLASSSPIGRKVATHLINALAAKNRDVPVILDAMDILSSLIAKHGHHLQPLGEPAVQSALDYLSHDRQAVRKRAINAIHKMTDTSATHLQQKVLEHVIDMVCCQPPIKPELLKTALQALGTLTTMRSVGQVREIIGIIYELAQNEDDELRESALSAIEAILRKAPSSVNNLEELMEILSHAIKHDPNYCDDFDDEEEDEDDEDYSDDEDVSWKVRRSAAKALDAMISANPSSEPIMKSAGKLLLNRLKEREESVLLEILNAFNTFVKCSKSGISHLLVDKCLFSQQISRKLKSTKTKICQTTISTLSMMLEICPDYICSESVQLLPNICRLMKDSSPSVRLEVLMFFSRYAKQVDENVATAASELIIPTLEGAIRDSFYRIVAEGLRVLLLLVQKGARCTQSPTTSAALEKLDLTDIDQDVKDSTILCAGALLAHNEIVSSSVDNTVRTLVERMSNEMTRMSALKALSQALSNSSIAPYIILYVNGQMLTLSSFLRKSNRQLRTTSLTFLKSLVKNGLKEVEQVLEEIPALVSEADLHVAQLAIELSRVCLAHGIAENTIITSKCLHLVKSSLLQGKPLEALQDYLADLAKSYPQRYKPTVRALTESIYGETITHRNEIRNAAKCIATFTISWAKSQSSTEKAIQPVVEQFLSDVQNSKTQTVEQFALLALGEIGCQVPLGGTVVKHQLAQFERNSDTVKMAAAIGLGLTAVGNLTEVLPLLLNNLANSGTQSNYLTLVAIREATKVSTNEKLGPYAADLFNQLQKYSGASEEGSRNVLSECLGRLVVVQPSLCEILHANCQSDDFRVRQTQLATAKVVCHLPELDIKPFLGLLSDQTVPVIRSAIAFMNSVAHNNPTALKAYLNDVVLMSLYKETKVRPDLIREVMMGPFKHKVDDGLEVRKAAFECLYSLLDTCHKQLDISVFLDHIENGFDDDYDVKLLTYLILLRVIHQSPNSLSCRLTKFLEHFKKILNMRVKQDAVKQEAERSDELKRAVVRVIARIINKSADIEFDTASSRAYQDILRLVQNVPELCQFLDQERKSTDTIISTLSFAVGDQMDWQ